MTTQQVHSDNKKSKWLIIPFVVILLLSGITYLIKSIGAKGNKTAENIENTIHNPSEMPAFSPQDIILMVEKNEDYIAGACRSKGFSYKASNDNSTFVNTKSENTYDGEIIYEEVTSWRDYSNRLLYCLHDENKYEYFVSEIFKLKPAELNNYVHDKQYPDSVHFVVNDCVFVPIGYKKDYGGFCVAAIKIDHIIQNNSNSETESTNIQESSNSEENTYIIKSDSAYVYTDAYEVYKSSMVLKHGKKVNYIETRGEFIKCKYDNDEGIPIEGYILVNDVGRAK